MFWKKKKREGLLDEEELPSFSSWTPLKKLGAFAAIAAASISIGYSVDSCESEFRKKREYVEFVQGRADGYGKVTGYAVAEETCMKPGSRAKEYSDLIRYFGILDGRSGLKVIDGRRTAAEFCIRPADSGQDVSLESRLRISGISYSDFRIDESSAVLKLESKVPAVVPHSFSITGVSINGKNILSSYVLLEQRGFSDDAEHASIDLAKLVEDKVLSRSDFGKDLEIIIQSRISIEQFREIGMWDVLGVSAYEKVAGKISDYVNGSEDFPAGHQKIKEIVKRYRQPHDNVHDIMMYALDVTDKALEYRLPGLGLDPIKTMEAGKGKCTDYANIFITIMRGFGVPARYVEGPVLSMDGKKLDGRHAWAEVLVPFRDGGYRWVLVEPTWADNDVDPYSYIGYASRKHMYEMGFSVALETDIRSEINMFQEHEWKSAPAGSGKRDLR